MNCFRIAVCVFQMVDPVGFEPTLKWFWVTCLLPKLGYGSIKLNFPKRIFCTSTYHLTASSWLLVDLAVILICCCIWVASDHTLLCRKMNFKIKMVGGEVIETPSAAYKTAVINQYTNRPLKTPLYFWSTERISKPYLQLGRLSHWPLCYRCKTRHMLWLSGLNRHARASHTLS